MKATVWIGPEPLDGSHTHYVGNVRLEQYGVFIPEGSKFKSFQEGEWLIDNAGHVETTTVPTLVPWHRVHEISWLERPVVKARRAFGKVAGPNPNHHTDG